MINKVMVNRLSSKSYGGSFPNDYARRHHTKLVIDILFALSLDDLAEIKEEIEQSQKLNALNPYIDRVDRYLM